MMTCLGIVVGVFIGAFCECRWGILAEFFEGLHEVIK